MKKKLKITHFIRVFYIIVAVAGIGLLLFNHQGWSNALWYGKQDQSKTKEPYVQSTSEQTQQGLNQNGVIVESQGETQTQKATEAEKGKASEAETMKTEAVTTQEATVEDTTAAEEEPETVEAAEETESDSYVELTTQPGKSYSVTISGASFVNVRRSDVSKAKTVGVLNKGATGTLLEVGKYCSLIEANGIKGYVYNKYLTITER